ncbi:(2Fe-2S)-binding protein [Mycolicibacterium agri]|uniref:(2Fe-2S)-binding protein n=1 Tax=Mycolicibacterium agri TaxID=36811 RepID=A0A2A7N3G1_MYCAG|nr:Rieske (2Fe-2S) protein [Mycolicibacterium agri]PEG38434.1 (2Fe-2S)-binding protein [Mycolicibacterium agri]GFG53883.1 hypothetical protein MAGR_53240 [Mycolicibacterium agri]
MSGRTVRRFVDNLLNNRRSERAHPDDIEAREMKTAIQLRAARAGSDAPREEFVTELHRRLTAHLEEGGDIRRAGTGTRRAVLVGTGLAAASAAGGIVIGRNLLTPNRSPSQGAPPPQTELEPNAGAWYAVGRSAELPDGGALAFDVGAVNGFVHRSDAQLEAVSGVCTHQGCKLWLDSAEGRLRCPCHSTSFSLQGETMTHQLPTAPAPLPKLQVREIDGMIQVFAPTKPA